MTAPVSDRTRFYQEDTDVGSHLSPEYNQAVIQELLLQLEGKSFSCIADLGSGVGLNVETLSSLFTRAQIVTLDLSWSVLKSGSEKSPAVTPAQSDAAAIPLADGCVDLVVCTEVLEHVETMDRVFKEMHRVLKRDGWAVISSPNYLNPMGFRKWINDRRLGQSFWDPWGGHPGFERLMLPSVVGRAFRPYFEVRAIRGAGYLMGWIPLGYRRIGAKNDRFPLRAIGRLPLLKHIAINRYLLLRRSG